jgi:transcriptional regulator with XRE-family HTH domain
MQTERLREVRERRGLSQEDLAKRTGLSASQIFRIETGRSEPSADAVIRIAKELEVSTDYLFGLVDGPTEHLTIHDLSPMEWKLIQAYRRGDFKELVLTAANAQSEKPDK